MILASDKSMPCFRRAARPRAVLLSFALAIATTTSLHAAPTIQASNTISLPVYEVLPTPQTLYATGQVVTLRNNNDPQGWLLSCEVVLDHLEGQATGSNISATAYFTSISWTKGGTGSTAGISITPDGSQIEAQPGFGEGSYEIIFDVRIDVPALPSADQYSGLVSISVQ